MGQLSHLAAYGAEVLNRDGGAARTQIRPQVTLAAVLCELLDQSLFGFVKLTLINGDGLFLQLAPSNSSLHYLGSCRLLQRLFLFLVIVLGWWIQNRTQLLLFGCIRAGWCC